MDFLVEKWQLDKFFQSIFCSGYEAMKKTDKRFFETVLEKTEKKPSEILYIDDRQENVEWGRKQGMKVVCYHDSEGLSQKLLRLLGSSFLFTGSSTQNDPGSF